MRRLNGESRAVNSTYETINAAATAIASAETRGPPQSQKRRWGSCWSIYWCFGSHKQTKRIGHAVLVPETPTPGTDTQVVERSMTQQPSRVLPFVAPPSSPASFLPSEPASATQSPAGLLSLTSISANMYSPGGPNSIFAIGPYAHETQLVSPPVFSTFTTEPSTAPFTPPPESVHLTTPSSPEVPFAQLLDPNHRRFPYSQYEFQSYQLYPGSPVGQLISPSSGISGSGTSSPFPDPESVSHGPHFLEFRTGGPPQLLNKLNTHDWGSRLGSGSLTPDAPSNEIVVDHRVSFELTPENIVRCVEKEPEGLARAVSASLQNHETGKVTKESLNDGDDNMAENEEEKRQQHQKHRSITLGSVKEFNFDNADGGCSDKEGKNWSFFPMMQPGVS